MKKGHSSIKIMRRLQQLFCFANNNVVQIINNNLLIYILTHFRTTQLWLSMTKVHLIFFVFELWLPPIIRISTLR